MAQLNVFLGAEPDPPGAPGHLPNAFNVSFAKAVRDPCWNRAVCTILDIMAQSVTAKPI